MTKQTAVEWLEKRFYFTKGQLIDIDFETAKAKEREQMGLPNCGPMDPNIKSVTIVDPATGKTYTTETYKGGEQ